MGQGEHLEGLVSGLLGYVFCVCCNMMRLCLCKFGERVKSENLSCACWLFIKSPYKISQQRSITQTTKVASNAANTEVRSTSQATCVAGNAAVADDRCVDQATKAATADDECTSQSTGIASKGLLSTAVLEMLEAIPDHDFFIQ